MKRVLPLIPLLVCLAACNNVPVVDVAQPKGDTLRDNMITANRYIAKSEETQIDAYVARRGWTMQRLTSGARVMETSRGNGVAINYEDTLSITYRVEALNGAVVYDNVDLTVVAGRLQPVRGLDAALLTLHHRSSARVILPSEQAYGVVGDGDRIGTRMVLVYDLKVNN